MFKVDNADFIADKLAAELLPNQEYREAAKNAEEAIERRRHAEAGQGLEPAEGLIEFDVDWALHEQDPNLWYLAVADDGDGMNRNELEKYMTTLAVTGANRNQSITGNQGMGLKIAGPTRHKEGVLIRSLKDGQRTMIQIGWTGREYAPKPLNETTGDFVVEVPEELFPQFILDQGSGTVVTFLGKDPGANTIVPDRQPKIWLTKYLHQRFFRLGQNGIKLMVRQPAKDVGEWPTSRESAEAADYFNKTAVIGTGGQWDRYADRDGGGKSGAVDLPGMPSAAIPPARLHWWVLPPVGPGNDLTSRTYGGGSLAILFQNELHDWRTSGQANPFFARLGIIFGKQRISFVLEPIGETIASDFARAHVLVDGRPVFETDAWAVWADQFRDPERMPDAIKKTVAEEQDRLHEEDPDRAKRIRDRLKEVVSMLRPRRARRDPHGSTTASGSDVTGSGSGSGSGVYFQTPIGPGPRQTGHGATQGIGALLPQVDVDGEQASEVFAALKLTPRWVTEAEAENLTIVNADGNGLRDRAAAVAGVDGLTASELLLNLEFRGYRSILQYLNDWGNPDGDDVVAAAIEAHTQEWVEQKMVEAVTGLRQLQNGSTWTATAYDAALSPLSLTSAFMADRYHTVREVKRLVGPLRQKPAATAADK